VPLKIEIRKSISPSFGPYFAIFGYVGLTLCGFGGHAPPFLSSSAVREDRLPIEGGKRAWEENRRSSEILRRRRRERGCGFSERRSPFAPLLVKRGAVERPGQAG